MGVFLPPEIETGRYESKEEQEKIPCKVCDKYHTQDETHSYIFKSVPQLEIPKQDTITRQVKHQCCTKDVKEISSSKYSFINYQI